MVTMPRRQRSGRTVNDLATMVLFESSLLMLAIGVASVGGTPGVLAGAIVFAVVTAFLIWRPASAVYVLAGGAVLFETFQLEYPDSLTDAVPFFRSLSSVGLGPIAFSAAELLMLGTLTSLIVSRLLRGQSPLLAGRFLWPMAAFLLVVTGGVVHGLLTGGEFSIVVWEVRGFLYLVLGYLLVVNLIRNKGQVRVLFWVLLAGIAIKGVLGSWRYLVTLQRDLSLTSVLSTTNSILSHEESFLFAFFITFIIAVWLLRANRGQSLLVTVAAFPVMLAFLANQRRVSVLILVMGFLLVATLVYLTTRWRRGVIVAAAAMSLVLMPLYVAAFSTGEGILANPATALASAYQPGIRDLSSNEYRILENQNLTLNIKQRPIWGDGFGKPLPLLVQVPDLTSLWSLWPYIPHNTALWIWHRLGIVGFMAFWFMAGRLLIGGIHATRSVNDVYLRLVGIMAVVGIVGWVTMGLLDLGFVDFRSSILVGILAGLLSLMPALDVPEAEPSAPARAYRRH